MQRADSCMTANDYLKALPLCEEALQLIKRPNKYPEEYEVVRFMQADCYIRNNRLPEGITILEDLEKRNLVLLDKCVILYNLGRAYLYNGQTESAIKCFEESKELYPRERGIDAFYWEGLQLSLALSYINNKQGDVASEIINGIVDYARDSLATDEHIDLLTFLEHQFVENEDGQSMWSDRVAVRILQELSDYSKAQGNIEQYVVYENKLANIYQVLGDFPNAYIHGINAIDNYQESFSFPFSVLYIVVAAPASRMNQFDTAIELLNEAEAISQTEEDEEWRKYMQKEILGQKAIIYIDQGINAEETINILKSALDDNDLEDIERGANLYNLGQAYEMINDYDNAFASYDAALRLYDKAEGHGILYAKTLNKMGINLRNKGDLTAAEEYFEIAIDIFRRLSETSNYSYILSLGHASLCALEMLEYGRALSYAEECRDLQLHTNNVFFVDAWNVLFDCYEALNDEQNREVLFEETRRLFADNVFSQIRYSLHDAQKAYDLGEVEKGLQLFKHASELFDSAPSCSDKDYLNEFIFAIGEQFLPREVNLFDYITTILSKKEGLSTDEKMAVARIAYAMAKDYDYSSANMMFHLTFPTWIDSKDYDYLYASYLSAAESEDFEFCSQLATLIEQYINGQMKSVIGLSEAEKELYWSNVLRFKNLLFSYLDVDEDIELMYNISVACKSFLLRSNIVLSNIIAESGDKYAKKEVKELKDTRQKLNDRSLYNSPVEVDSLRLREIELNRSLVSRIRNYSNSAFLASKTFSDIVNALQISDVAIEIDECYLPNGDKQYFAFLVDKSLSHPLFINLCLDSEIERLIKIAPSKLYDSNYPFSEQLFNYIWGPLLPFLTNKSNIYISPAGKISTIAIEALSDSQGNYISDSYSIARLSSTAEICKRAETEPITTASVFGGILYDNSSNTLELDQRLVYNDNDYLTDRAGTETIDYLPGTKIEANDISKILSNSHIPTVSYLGYEATEESFKALSGSANSVIHIATHGFYKPIEAMNHIGYFRDSDININVLPMRRSGLLMAGCNDAWNGAIIRNGEDGVLTASEIAELDLSLSRLVVLSACETGLGEVTEDGIAGLQRAFKNAGVKSLIMSLWKVDDKATSLLMSEFYSLMAKGVENSIALNLAKKKVRQKKHYSNPYFWAGFILLD